MAPPWEDGGLDQRMEYGILLEIEDGSKEVQGVVHAGRCDWETLGKWCTGLGAVCYQDAGFRLLGVNRCVLLNKEAPERPRSHRATAPLWARNVAEACLIQWGKLPSIIACDASSDPRRLTAAEQWLPRAKRMAGQGALVLADENHNHRKDDGLMDAIIVHDVSAEFAHMPGTIKLMLFTAAHQVGLACVELGGCFP